MLKSTLKLAPKRSVPVSFYKPSSCHVVCRGYKSDAIEFI